MQRDHLILHVDDDPDDLAMLQTAFESLGSSYELLQQTDGQQCLDTLTNWPADKDLPCLIVLDINMPGIDGKQTFAAIKKTPRLASIPIIIFSTSSSALDKLFFKGKNVEYIVKPFTIELLTQIADHMLRVCKRNEERS